MEKVARSLPLFALALFLVSLLLPALRTDRLHGYLLLEGWLAASYALAAWHNVPRDVSCLVVALSSALNVMFPVMAWLVLQYLQSLKQHLPLAIAIAAVMGLLAVWAPYSLPGRQFLLLSGYYVWIAAHVLLLGGLVLLSVQAREAQLTQQPAV